MRPCAFLISMAIVLASKEQDRVEESATVVKEILDIPDGIPQELLDKAECIVVLPSVKKFAIGIGGSYGRGVLVCRSGEDFKGAWGPPALYRLEGGNIGGADIDDVVLTGLHTGGR